MKPVSVRFVAQQNMKRVARVLSATMFVVSTLAITLAMSGCSNTTNAPTGEPEVSFSAELSTANVSAVAAKSSAQTQAVTALQIQRIRLLVKELKVKPAKDNTPDKEKQIKLSPFVIEWKAGQITVFATSLLPAGEYDQVKFQFHRFTPPEVAQYQNDAIFRDFVLPDRVTAIIEGTVTDNGRTEAFVYRSDVTANLNLNFDNVLSVAASGATTITLQFNPLLVFKKGIVLIDPRDAKNRNDIDNAIRTAVRAVKK